LAELRPELAKEDEAGVMGAADVVDDDDAALLGWADATSC